MYPKQEKCSKLLYSSESSWIFQCEEFCSHSWSSDPHQRWIPQTQILLFPTLLWVALKGHIMMSKNVKMLIFFNHFMHCQLYFSTKAISIPWVLFPNIVMLVWKQAKSFLKLNWNIVSTVRSHFVLNKDYWIKINFFL